MSGTIYAVVQGPTAPFEFQPTLDGQVYRAVTSWSTFGNRWYLNILNQFGTFIVSLPLVGSPTAFIVESASWENGSVEMVTSEPHYLPIGSLVNLTVDGCLPVAYNGVVQCAVLDPVTLSYPLTLDPGNMTTLGSVGYEINLMGGYFTTSTLTYFDDSNTIVVRP